MTAQVCKTSCASCTVRLVDVVQRPRYNACHYVWVVNHRDNALGPATLEYAQELEESVEALNATLYNTSAFAVGPNFEGIIGVATEIVAKKVKILLYLCVAV